jgi:hypothetical protein
VCQGCRGRAWHSPPALEARKAGKPDANVTAQSSGKKKMKKAVDKDKPLAGAPTAVVTGGGYGPRGDKRSCQASGSDDGGAQSLVHNSRRHSAEEC